VGRGAGFRAGGGVAPAGTATSSFRITWLVPRDRVDEVVQGLHRMFIEHQPTAA
jgi:hypothetical protein